MTTTVKMAHELHKAIFPMCADKKYVINPGGAGIFSVGKQLL